jgi:phosphatidylethanolamine-binding protein (PEBP) family uncharacterized protein
MRLDIGENATKATLEAAIKGHIRSEAQLTGLYKRSR